VVRHRDQELQEFASACSKAALSTPDLGIATPDLWLDTVKDLTIDAMMTEIRNDLRRLGVQQDIPGPPSTGGGCSQA